MGGRVRSCVGVMLDQVPQKFTQYKREQLNGTTFSLRAPWFWVKRELESC